MRAYLLLLLASPLIASAFVRLGLPSTTKVTPTALSATARNNNGELSRKQTLQTVATGLLASVLLGQLPAGAISLGKANDLLSSYGLPPVIGVPDGCTSLVEFYGKLPGAKKERKTLLVQFAYPLLWVVSRPNVDKNGEEGTISAADYQKGDSAAFYAGDALGRKLSENDKEALGEVVIKAISQKGDNQYQNFKVKKTEKGPSGYKGAQYFLVEYTYELLTGAGFTVDRRGWASVTQVGDGVQALVTGTTALRWKKMGETLHDVAESFRVYDGITA